MELLCGAVDAGQQTLMPSPLVVIGRSPPASPVSLLPSTSGCSSQQTTDSRSSGNHTSWLPFDGSMFRPGGHERL